jgi:uncharacterized OB-fold protein
MTDTVSGPLPELVEPFRFFWTAGSEGELRFQRCGDCDHWLHPPGVSCPLCGSESIAEQAVSGVGTVVAASVNYQPWMPGLEVPYALAIVELDEQQGLRLTTRIVGVPPEEVRIGQRVQVQFEQREDVWLPLFTPLAPEPGV